MRTALAVLVVTSCVLPAWSAEPQPRRLGDDLFLAGDHVHFADEIRGDALLAGGAVVLDGRVGGDAAMAGGRLELRGAIGEDLYASGGELDVDGSIGGSARIAGGRVRIGRSAVIGAGLSVAGGQVELAGRVTRYAQIAGGRVRIDGHIEGDVDVAGGELRIGPAAVVAGRVDFRGPRPPIVAPGARLAGGIHHVPQTRWGGGRGAGALVGFAAAAWFVGWALAGALLLVLFPGATREVTAIIRTRPGPSVLLGLAVLAAVPVAIVALAVTLVGIPLALLVAGLYLLLLPLGYLVGVAALGDSLLPRLRRVQPVSTGMRIAAFVVLLIVMSLVGSLPFIGSLAMLALLLAGMGGLVLALRASRVAAPGPPGEAAP